AQDRLACYDRVFGPPSTAPAEAADTPERAVPKSVDAEAREHGPAAASARASLIERRWELRRDQKQGTFRVAPHKPVYILAAFHSSRANNTPSSPSEGHSVLESLGLRDTEAKFQVSLKSKL